MLFANMRFKRAMKNGIEELGLHIASEAELDGSAYPLTQQVREMVARGELTGFLPLFDEAWASKARTESGDRVWARLLVVLEAALTERPEHALAAARRLFEQQPSPSTAGIYATQLVNRGYALRGTGYAETVGREQWEGMRALHEQAHEVLSDFAGSGDENVLWLEATQSLLAGSVEDAASYLELHERAWRLDRADISALSNAGNMLLPRWHGRSYQDVEDFAAHAAALTAEEFGEGGYAAVYSYFGNLSDLEVEETRCDLDRLRVALIDLFERFPGQRSLNRVVRTASWAGLEAEVLRFFAAPFTAVEPWFWGGGDPDTALELAWRARQYAVEDQG